MHVERYRLFEWVTSSTMMTMALILLISPQAATTGDLHVMRGVGLSAPLLAVTFALGGCLRLAALYANGHWPLYGPRCRALGALVGAILWAQMGLALLMWTTSTGQPSVSIALYAGLTVGEMVSCYRAAADAGT